MSSLDRHKDFFFRGWRRVLTPLESDVWQIFNLKADLEGIAWPGNVLVAELVDQTLLVKRKGLTVFRATRIQAARARLVKLGLLELVDRRRNTSGHLITRYRVAVPDLPAESQRRLEEHRRQHVDYFASIDAPKTSKSDVSQPSKTSDFDVLPPTITSKTSAPKHRNVDSKTSNFDVTTEQRQQTTNNVRTGALAIDNPEGRRSERDVVVVDEKNVIVQRLIQQANFPISEARQVVQRHGEDRCLKALACLTETKTKVRNRRGFIVQAIAKEFEPSNPIEEIGVKGPTTIAADAGFPNVTHRRPDPTGEEARQVELTLSRLSDAEWETHLDAIRPTLSAAIRKQIAAGVDPRRLNLVRALVFGIVRKGINSEVAVA